MKTYTLTCLIAGLIANLGTLAAQTLFVPDGTVGTSSTGNVGIGMADPAAKLDVGGYVRAIDNGTNFYPTTGRGLELNANSSAGWIIAYDRDAHTILPLVLTGSVLSLNAYTSAFVGVGTTTPTDRLTIKAAGTPSVAILNANWAIGDEAVLRFRHGDGTGDGAGNGAQSEIRSYLPGGGNSDLRFYTTNYLVLNSVPAMTLTGLNNVGINTTSPVSPLHVAGGASMSAGWNRTATIESTYPVLMFNSNATRSAGIGYDFGYAMRFWVNCSTADIGSGIVAISVMNNGNVGIGTFNPTYPLAVNGTVRAKEVIVDTGWSDFVFDPGYRLTPLSEVERQIRAEKHLPGIPSAQEVAQGGVSVGDMQARLLQKIEELTLHLIQQEKQLNEQRAQIEHQNQLIRRLEDETHNLTTE